ncbi:DUF3179 domain-containing protein [Rhodovibrionaceae bacterium A322]
MSALSLNAFRPFFERQLKPSRWLLCLLAGILVAVFSPPQAQATPESWASEWPETDFNKHSVDFKEILSGGPPKDGIPSIDKPRFKHVSKVELPGTEPVIGLTVNGHSRAYPLRILTWHEIVNDTLGGVPVTVTYCPLCNAALVFDRRLGDQVLDFGTTGKLRNSDLVMYDRQTQSWWQQFLGRGIVGELTGEELTLLPARLESWDSFRTRLPQSEVLVPNNPDMRPYGANPYVGYDSAAYPFLYKGDLPKDIEPMAYVIAIEDDAWPLKRLQAAGQIETDSLRMTWTPGLSSALDKRAIAESRDLGNVVVQEKDSQGQWQDRVYDLTFAFVFYAFRPDGKFHLN